MLQCVPSAAKNTVIFVTETYRHEKFETLNIPEEAAHKQLTALRT